MAQRVLVLVLLTLIVVNIGLILLTFYFGAKWSSSEATLNAHLEAAAKPKPNQVSWDEVRDSEQSGWQNPQNFFEPSCYLAKDIRGFKGYDLSDLKIDNILTIASKDDACLYLHRTFRGIEEQAIEFAKAAKKTRNIFGWLQGLTVFFSVAATVVVAIGNRIGWVAPWAIIPTAIVSLLTGWSSAYSLQDEFVRRTATRAELQQLESEIIGTATQIAGCVLSHKEPGAECDLINKANVKGWDDRRALTLTQSLSRYLQNQSDDPSDSDRQSQQTSDEQTAAEN